MEKDLYFKDEKAKYIFYYEKIKNKIMDSKHPKLMEAMKELEKLYKGMK